MYYIDRFLVSHAFGFHLSSHQLRGAYVSYSKGKVKIESLPVFPLASDRPQKLDSQWDKKECVIATGLSASDVLIRPLEIKLTKEKEIESVLPFQAEPLLPYPPENGIIQSIILSQKDGSSQLSVFAVRKDRLTKFLQGCDTLHLQPEIISCDPIALSFFAEQYGPFKDKRSLYAVHIGESHSLCILTRKGKLIGSYSFAFQASQLQSAEGMSSLRQEVTRCLFALMKQNKNQSLTEVLITGEVPQIQLFAADLSQAIHAPVNPPRPDAQVGLTQMQEHALAIGYALSALPQASSHINFRVQEFAYPTPWKRFKQPMILYAALCCLAALALLYFGKHWLGYKEDHLKAQFLELLTTADKTYPLFEQEYGSYEEPIPLKSMTLDELTQRIQHMDEEIQNTPDIFPLQPNLPRVSDLLAWLGIHPNVVQQGKEGKANPMIQLQHFSYSMLKRPQQGKKQEKYQVKVEIEFTAPTPKVAREFHDALMAPNPFVDPKGEIKWNAGKDRYRASFFLKDRTNYISTGES